MEQVRKRNNKVVPYNPRKIYLCIRKANANCKDARMPRADILAIIKQIETTLGKYKAPSVETIQDEVEKALMRNGWEDTAKAYIIYRNEHAKVRDTHESLMKKMMEIVGTKSDDADFKRSNANIPSDQPMGSMLLFGTTVANHYVDNYVLPKKYVEAHRNGWIHIHDKDFLLLTSNCLQTDVLKCFKGGFHVGGYYIREPKSVRSTGSLVCIILQTQQNALFGGESIQNYDRGMALGIRCTFKKEFLNAMRDYLSYECDDATVVNSVMGEIEGQELPTYQRPKELLTTKMEPDVFHKVLKKAYETACHRTENESYQAAETVIHNLNSMHSRAGSQVPFSSLNFGTDTSPEGRLAIRDILLAQEDGLGHHETALFPITIFRLKEGISYNPEDPNYDLFKLACRVSAKRLFPNFSNQDAPYNMQYYDPNDYRTEIAHMGCRTRVLSNVNGENITTGRGNFAFTTINLPQIALEAHGDIKKFYRHLDKLMNLCKEQLLWRFELIGKRHVYNIPFIYTENIWYKSEGCKPSDTIREMLKQASLSIGFVGLAECLVALIGKHHGESDEAQELGLQIIGHMREMTDKYTDETHLNFSLFATPAESTAGRFLKVTRDRFGFIPGVTSHEYFTNSFHIPVYYQTTAYHKIKVEAPYHALCNAGHISYIEMDGDPTKNLAAFEKIVRLMHDSGMGYFSINHSVDECPNCHHSSVIDGHVCPVCGYDEIREPQHLHVKRSECCCN